MENDNRAISVKSVSKVFQGTSGVVHALDEVSFDIFPGEFISIIGPSGCGKTTLIRSMASLEKISQGKILINGRTPNEARTNREFSFVFQSAALLEWRNTLENVMLPLEIMQIKKNEAVQKAKEMIAFVGLDGFEKSSPRQLSGGMQQRVSIARALTVDPSIIFMDEPFGALDQITREHMNFELLRMWELRKMTVIFITHNIREAILLSDRIIVMSARPGKIQGIMEIKLPRPRSESIRETEEFVAYELEGEKLLASGMKKDV